MVRAEFAPMREEQENDLALQPLPEQGPARTSQWGAEQSTTSLPIFHKRPSLGQLSWSRIAVILTAFSWAMYVVTTLVDMAIKDDFTTLRVVLEASLYLLIVTALVFSASMYLMSRRGALVRFRDHERVPRAVLDEHFSPEHYDAGITVLVPSYVEEIPVIEKTLWSAALQEFPDMRVVLLIDDPPYPTDPVRAEELWQTRRIGDKITNELKIPFDRFSAAHRRFQERIGLAPRVGGAELNYLSVEYRCDPVVGAETRGLAGLGPHRPVLQVPSFGRFGTGFAADAGCCGGRCCGAERADDRPGESALRAAHPDLRGERHQL